MKTELTPEQSRAVYDRDSNILVSAAAGSGKTKVLVDRILSKITDKDHPVNVDEFLVVTFTNGAAAQMREKIADKLMKTLEDNPENEHLARQQLLVNRADIATIDSFCLKVVKENINKLDIDTTFSIGDRGMMELIKSDVISELFDKNYENSDFAEGFVSFSDLVDIFDEGKSEDNLKNTLLTIYNKASSYPRPKVWLEQAREALMIDNVEDISRFPWMDNLTKEIKNSFNVAKFFVERALELCYVQGGPDNNIDIIEKDREQILNLCQCNNYEEISQKIHISWGRQKPCKGEIYNQDIIEQFKDYRESYKSAIKEMEAICYSPEEIVSQNKILRTYLIPLIDLVLEFGKCYMEAKKQKKVLDFSDVEHYAYELLVDGYDENGNVIPSKLGINISEEYEEIFIDEYQDSNFLQEDILTAVSGVYSGNYNMFMVGDVKQSIYRFRMARPDLFIKKYDRYGDEGKERKIELKNNFRSRDVVLLPVNYFFYQLMGEDLGGITYNDNISLVPTMEFASGKDEAEEKRISKSAELLVVATTTEEETEETGINNLELEAHLIAQRIKELVNKDEGMLVYDDKGNKYRTAEYRDIVILTRSLKDVGDVIYNVLSSYGIPVYLSEPKGYFNAVEVNVLMSLLSIVDNSRQDVPFAAVLLSPIVGLNESELAMVCDYSKVRDIEYLYHKCELYIMDKDDSVSGKLSRFFEILQELKEKKKTLSISSLIWLALEKTNYYSYVSAMPMGNKRRANIDMLLEKADSYEDGYYKGLFNFLRYVEKLKINEVDFGEASIVGEEENVVKIMTMHASKGLEYPIVFASALGKQFNKREYKEKVIIHSDYYLAAPIINIDKRYIKKSSTREVFKNLSKTESIAEELRILYVAMTRAKEKLILTGYHRNPEEYMEKYSYLRDMNELLLPYDLRKNTTSFMDVILKSMIRYDILANKLKVNEMIKTKIFTKASVVDFIASQTMTKRKNADEIFINSNVTYNEELYSQYKEDFEYQYPYSALTTMRNKMSISDIKKYKAYDGAGYDESEFDYTSQFDKTVTIENEPKDNSEKLSDTKALTGAQRGTIIHKFMELIPFAQMEKTNDYYKFCKDFLCELKKMHIFSEDEASVINAYKMKSFFSSSLGQRMIKADTLGKLVKEQQFSVGIPVEELGEIGEGAVTDSTDVVIVQGIIDAFFYEGDEIVVMDYKTDRADRETLINRYNAQLDYYGDTIKKITGKNLKEKIIYSFSLEEEIQL